MVAREINPPEFIKAALVRAVDHRFPNLKLCLKDIKFSFDRKNHQYSATVDLYCDGESIYGSLWVCERVDDRELTCNWRCTRDWND